MKKLIQSYFRALSSLDCKGSVWTRRVTDLWIAIGIPISVLVLIFGMLATFGFAEIHVLGEDRSGMEAFVATIAMIVIAIPLIFAAVGTIMWVDHRFLNWRSLKSHFTNYKQKKPTKSDMATPRKPSD